MSFGKPSGTAPLGSTASLVVKKVFSAFGSEACSRFAARSRFETGLRSEAGLRFEAGARFPGPRPVGSLAGASVLIEDALSSGKKILISIQEGALCVVSRCETNSMRKLRRDGSGEGCRFVQVFSFNWVCCNKLPKGDSRASPLWSANLPL